jgi:hypothetical protein
VKMSGSEAPVDSNRDPEEGLSFQLCPVERPPRIGKGNSSRAQRAGAISRGKENGDFLDYTIRVI